LPKKLRQKGRKFSSQIRVTLKLVYLQNYIADNNQILQSIKTFVVVSSKRKTNPRWRTAPFLKFKQLSFLRNGSSYCNEICQDDAKTNSELHRHFEILI